MRLVSSHTIVAVRRRADIKKPDSPDAASYLNIPPADEAVDVRTRVL